MAKTEHTYIIRIMKRHIFILFALSITTTATAGTNPLFAPGTENSIGIFIGQSTGDGDLGHLINPFDWDISPMTFFGIQYSQPTTILRMPSRINVEAMQNIAYDSASGASFGAVGISWDIALFSWCGFYVGAGLGEYLRDSGDQYVTSRLVFGERVFIGAQISDHFHAEIFTMHFSNGDFTETNHGLNFIGATLRYSF